MYRFQADYEKIQTLIDQTTRDSSGGSACSDGFAAALRREQIPHLSFSQITTVEACEYRYYLQYVCGQEPDPVPSYFTKGRLLHEVIAEAYQQIQCSRPFSPKDHTTFLRSRYQEHDLHHLLNSVEVVHQNLWEDVRVRAIEHPFVMTLDEALPPFVGVIDLVLENEDALYIVDHKTGRSFYQPDTMQMALYQVYAQRSFGVEAIRAFYDQYRWVENLARIRKPAFQRIQVQVTPADVRDAVRRVLAGYARIEALRANGKPAVNGTCYSCPYRPCG